VITSAAASINSRLIAAHRAIAPFRNCPTLPRGRGTGNYCAFTSGPRKSPPVVNASRLLARMARFYCRFASRTRNDGKSRGTPREIREAMANGGRPFHSSHSATIKPRPSSIMRFGRTLPSGQNPSFCVFRVSPCKPLTISFVLFRGKPCGLVLLPFSS